MSMHLVMFDIDGTLVDSRGFDGDLFAAAVECELGVRVDKTWRSYRHVTDSGVLEEVLAASASPSGAAEARDRVRRRFIRLVEEHLSGIAGGLNPIPGASALMQKLRSISGVTVAIATGGWRETAELKLHAAGIEFERLAFATSSDTVARTDIMRLAERQAMTCGPFTRRTYFGDAPWDAQACAESGYNFVGIGNRVDSRPRFADFRDQGAILEMLDL